MQTNINGRVLPAHIVENVGYANLQDAMAALGLPMGGRLLVTFLSAAGIPIRADADGTAMIGLRRLAEVAGLVHEYVPAEDLFYIGVLPGPTVAIPDAGVGAGLDPWIPVVPVVANGPGQRSATALRNVIAQFRVAVNPRYAIRDTTGDGEDDTFCNIFAWDFGVAMGAPLPFYLGPHDEPAKRGEPGAWEVNANAMVSWLKDSGWRFGWIAANAQRALDAANLGKPAVACWFNPAGGPGHIAVVRPGAADPDRGIPIAQAGGRCCDDGFLLDGFGSSRIQAVRCYIHD